MKKIFYVFLIFLITLVLISILTYFDIRDKIDSAFMPYSTEEKVFVIESGTGVKEIAKNLEEEGLIIGSDFFEVYVWENDLGSELRAGTYTLSPSMTIEDMVELFVYGEDSGIKSNEVVVSIPEGFSNQEILAKVKETEGLYIEDDFDSLDIDFSRYDFITNTEQENFLQGYLFPDTYNFYKYSSLENIATKMLDNFDSKVTKEMREDIETQGKNIEDVIILASIVEKEAANTEEMPTIASVFYNRLEIGQMLQSDATVNYIVGEGRASATTEDLEIDSPFNTYKHAGLVPYPICNPGIEAIKAAIYPADTDYYYFLTTQDEERTTYFSRTYEEHIANKYKYLN